MGLLKTQQQPHLICVGSAQGRDDYVAALKRRADEIGIGNRFVTGLEGYAIRHAAADLAIVPTIRPEPFGRTIIEAQAACLPVIGSDAGAIAKPLSPTRRKTAARAGLPKWAMRQH